MKMTKKLICALLSATLFFSALPVNFTAFAVENVPQNTTTDTVYTYEELREISDKYKYDLTETEIDLIISGETTLADITADREEAVAMIVQLSPCGVLATHEDALQNGMMTAAVAREEYRILDRQAKVQSEIKNDVFDGSALDVIYSYTLVANAFAILARPSQLNEIAAVEGVESVYTAPEYEPVPTDAQTQLNGEVAANYFTGSDNTTAYKGEGSVVSIIDTGIDLTHEAFANDVANPKINEQYINNVLGDMQINSIMNGAVTAKEVYHSNKIPFAFNYSDSNYDVTHNNDDEGDHGTHVAGITAGYAVNAEGEIVFEGVAPQAQIIVMKVFGSRRAGNFADILAAVEDSVKLGVDAINLSLGSWAGFTYAGDYPAVETVYQSAANAGIVVSCSAGNDYTSAKGNLYGNDLSLASNPDNGNISSPASYDDNLAVASAASKSFYAKTITIGGREVAYTCNATEQARNIERYIGKEGLSFAVLKDGNGNMLTGTAGDFKNFADTCSVSGKFVVVRRGQTFTRTVANAEDAGAIGLIVCNNVNGSLVNMAENTGVSIPAIFISMEDGDFIAQSGDTSLSVSTQSNYVTNPGIGTMSDFSSWGVTADLKLKPEITAYGGMVYSSRDDNTYGLMSGTSMAAPYITGVAALVAQRYRQLNPDSATIAKKNYATSLMMSTANPVIDNSSATTYSPRKQGAGLVDIDAALTSEAYITVDGSPSPKIDFGDDPAKEGVYELSFDVVNTGSQTLSFDIGANVQTEAVTLEDISYVTQRLDVEKADAYIEHIREIGGNFNYVDDKNTNYIDELEDVKFMSGTPLDITGSSSVATDKNNNCVSIAANSCASVKVTISLSAETKSTLSRDFENGIYIEGYITLTSKVENQADLVVPYMGFYGDWTQAPIIDEGTWEQALSGENVYPQMSVSSGNSVFSGFLGATYTPLGTSYYCDTPFFFHFWDADYVPGSRNLISKYKSSGSITYYDDAAAAVTSLLRNAASINYKVTDAVSGELYADVTREYVRKTVYNATAETFVNAGYFIDDTYAWQGTDADDNHLPGGTKVIYTVTANLDYGDGGAEANRNNSYSFPVIIDGAAPELNDVEFVRDEETGDTIMHTTVSDDNYIHELSYNINGYNNRGKVDTTYNTTVILPNNVGASVTDVLNITEIGRNAGLTNVCSVQLEVKDWVGNNAQGGSYASGTDFVFPFFDNITLVYSGKLLPVGKSMTVTPDSTYGVCAAGGKPNPLSGNLSDFDICEEYVFTSSDTSVAVVNPAGIVTGVGTGYTTITVKGSYSGIGASFRLRVTDYELQKLIDETLEGGTLNYHGKDLCESVKIDKDITIDMGGTSLTGLDGIPAFEITGGNVVIKNGFISSCYSDDSESALIVDMLNDNSAAISAVGGTVTLENVTASGPTAIIDGEATLAGSAVKLGYGASLNVRNSVLTGLYAVNNKPSDIPEGGAVTLYSGDFEGMLGAVADADSVVTGDGAIMVDITNLTAQRGAASYFGTAEGKDYSVVVPSGGIYIDAQQIANGTVTENSALSYNPEKDCAVFHVNANGTYDDKNDNGERDSDEKGIAYSTQYIRLDGLSIDADSYKYAMMFTTGAPHGYCYSVYGNASTAKNVREDNYVPCNKDEPCAFIQDETGRATWTGTVNSLYFWPCYATSTTATRCMTADVEIYAVIFFKTEAEVKSYFENEGKCASTNIKVADAQTFNAKLILSGTNLNVNVAFPEMSADSSFIWKPQTLKLYKKVMVDEYNYTEEFVASKSISLDESREINTVFEGIDPNAVYVVHCDCALELTNDNTADLYRIPEEVVSRLVNSIPELMEDAFGMNTLKKELTELVNYMLYDMHEGVIARDARHYDCPLSPSKVATHYPFYSDYPDIIGRGANNKYGTWTDFYENDVLKNNIIGTSNTPGYFYYLSKLLGDEIMSEAMAGLEATLPSTAWSALDENYRTGNYGSAGSLVSYMDAALAVSNALSTGDSARSRLANGLRTLNENIDELYCVLHATRLFLTDPDYEIASYKIKKSDPFIDRIKCVGVEDSYLFKYNDNHDIICNILSRLYPEVDNLAASEIAFSNFVKKTGIIPALSSYGADTEALLSAFFDYSVIENGSLDTGSIVEFAAEANYDGYITYELNGGINDFENPAGYQRALPVLFRDPVKTGYTFCGWYTSADFSDSSRITATDTNTDGDLQLFAKWEINTYHIRYYDGDNLIDDAEWIFDSTVSVTDKIPGKLGYVFRYWYESDENTPYIFGNMPDGDVTLYAKYSYIDLPDVNFTGDAYEWQYDTGTPVRLEITSDCIIDFAGKTITNTDNQAMIVIKNNANVTIQNAVFAPADYAGLSDENTCIYVTEGSSLCISDCIIDGQKTAVGENSYCSGNAVTVDDGTVSIVNSRLTGLFAVNNSSADGVVASPAVTVYNSILAGVVAAVADSAALTAPECEPVDVASFVLEADETYKAQLAENRILSYWPRLPADSISYEFDRSTAELSVNAQTFNAPSLPDGTSFSLIPTDVYVNGVRYPMTEGRAVISNIFDGEQVIDVKFDRLVSLSADAVNTVNDVDDTLAVAALNEISEFDSLLPVYDECIGNWTSNRQYIKSKFDSQSNSSTLVKQLLETIGECLRIVGGSEYSGSAEDGKGIFPIIRDYISAYKLLTTDSEKLTWILANSTDLFEKTAELNRNFVIILNECESLNGLSIAYTGDDYSEKLGYVSEITEKTILLRNKTENIPAVAAEEYEQVLADAVPEEEKYDSFINSHSAQEMLLSFSSMRDGSLSEFYSDFINLREQYDRILSAEELKEMNTLQADIVVIGGSAVTENEGDGIGLLTELFNLITDYSTKQTLDKKREWMNTNGEALFDKFAVYRSCSSSILTAIQDTLVDKYGIDNIRSVYDNYDNAVAEVLTSDSAVVGYYNDLKECVSVESVESLVNTLLATGTSPEFSEAEPIEIKMISAGVQSASFTVYKISYNVFDCVTGVTDTVKQYYLEGDAVTPPSPEAREGRVFKAWDGVPSVMPAENLSFSTEYEIGQYSVKYYVDGEAYEIIPGVEYTSQLPLPADPEKKGYTFTGWTAVGYEEFPESMPGNDVVCTANFTIKSYTVTFKVLGESIAVRTADYGSTLTDIPEIPAREHYGDTAPYWDVSDFTNITDNMTVNAVYTANSYTITWSINGKTKTEQYVYNTMPCYKGSAPVKNADSTHYYTFNGWNSEIVPAVSNTTYTAVFKANDKQHYAYSIPQNLSTVYGQKLMSVSLPAGFKWNNALQTVGNVGTKTFYATFTPTDTEHYLIDSDVSISVVVRKAIPVYTIPNVSVKVGHELRETSLPAGFSWQDGSFKPDSVGSFNYTVTFTPSDTENYETVTNITVPVTVIDPTENCDCGCHSDSAFKRFIFKICLFFWKLFKTHQYCECGEKHY